MDCALEGGMSGEDEGRRRLTAAVANRNKEVGPSKDIKYREPRREERTQQAVAASSRRGRGRAYTSAMTYLGTTKQCFSSSAWREQTGRPKAACGRRHEASIPIPSSHLQDAAPRSWSRSRSRRHRRRQAMQCGLTRKRTRKWAGGRCETGG